MIIKARFASVCSRCHGPINVDDQIDWTRGNREVTHAKQETCDLLVAAQRNVPQTAPLELGAIVTFLRRAAEVLKHPKARFLSPEKTEMRLSIAGARSKNPGSIQITISGAYVGCVLPDGRPHGPLARMTNVLELLVAIAEDPANAAAAYGAMMSRCSFCNLPLTDEGSVEVGYGPICARSWKLPWARFGVPELTAIPEVPSEEAERAELVRLLNEAGK